MISKQEALLVGSLMPLAALAGDLVGGLSLEVFGRKTKKFNSNYCFHRSWVVINICRGCYHYLCRKCYNRGLRWSSLSFIAGNQSIEKYLIFQLCIGNVLKLNEL